jgi:hypothetical protein
VWNGPTNEELAQEYLAANQLMLDVLEGPIKKFQERPPAIQANLQAVLRNLAKPDTQTGRGRARRERSPSVDMVESDAKATGKTVGKSRQTKRAQEEKGAQKTARRTLTPPKPDYKLVSPREEWKPAKRTEGTYRYNHKEWRKDNRDPWSIRGNRAGTLQRRATLYVRIPSVVPVWAPQGQRQVASIQDLRPSPAGKDPGKGEHHHAQQPEGARGPLLLRGQPCHVRA